MADLKISRLSYVGDKYTFQSPKFSPGLNIIEGENGAGKSTFFSLLYYGLGGRVPQFERGSREVHKEIVADSNNFVVVQLSVGGVEFEATRKIGDNSIRVLRLSDNESLDEMPETFPINRRASEDKIFSDWLLEGLGINVVEITQGSKIFKLNFTDLARLIYHSQEPDHTEIFKPADVQGSVVSDSLEVRRAIFEVLVGKTLLALYKALGELKRAEKRRDVARDMHVEYQRIVLELLRSGGVKEIRNQTYLIEKISELKDQVERLQQTREEVVQGAVGAENAAATIQIAQSEFEVAQGAKNKTDQDFLLLLKEKARLDEVALRMEDDVRRIQKIIHTQDQLNLFTPDTCPYCLSSVERPTDRCVCGSVVDEGQYRRYFYSSAEYIELLGGKVRSLQSIQAAAADIESDLRLSAAQREHAVQDLHSARDTLAAISSTNARRDNLLVGTIDRKIFELRGAISDLEQALVLEDKLAELQGRLDRANQKYNEIKARVLQLDGKARSEIAEKVTLFNGLYNESMTRVLSDCRVARIDSDTYLPVINNGEYREASAQVSKRFLYYLTLLRLSLTGDAPFPRILLIDTPENKGIDLANLNKVMSEIDFVSPIDGCQIILSTGPNKYPAKYADRVLLELTSDQKLLVPVVTSDISLL